MKKRQFTDAVLISLFLAASILFIPTPLGQYEFELIDQELEKGLELCEEVKENSLMIKNQILATALLVVTQDEGRIRLRELIANLYKADKLILESEIALALVSGFNADEKIGTAKKKLTEVNKLHKQTLKGLGALMPPKAKMILMIET